MFAFVLLSDCLGRRLGPKLLGRTNDSGVNFHYYMFCDFLMFIWLSIIRNILNLIIVVILTEAGEGLC